MDYLLYIFLFFLGIIAFLVSTVTGGGGAMLLLPILNVWMGPNITAPILNLGLSIGRPVRLVLFWKYIDWRMSFFYVLPAVSGVFFASLLFIELPKFWFHIVIGLFLVSTIFQYKFGRIKKSFKVEKWHFLPLGLIVGFLGTLTGSLGPVLNPFYINVGLDKESLIATKSANSFFVGLMQVASYFFIGIMNPEIRNYGIALGLGMAVGNWFGKKVLKKISSNLFHKMFLWMTVVSGVILIAKALWSKL